MKPSLYADDAKLFAPAPNITAKTLIQNDLDSVADWCHKWRLRLNADKCFYLQYRPRNCANDFPVYRIGETILPRKTNTTDLGVIISDDIKFHHQTQKACKDATRNINLIKRTFLSRSPTFLSNMLKTYVRPKLEYCVQVWNPVYIGDSTMMEKVQNRLTKMLPRGRQLIPEERNARLKITDHKTRRLRGDLIHVYEMYDAENLFPRASNNRTRGHSKKLKVQSVNLNLRKHSFTIRYIETWNSLPEDIVNAENLNIFKSKIDNVFNVHF